MNTKTIAACTACLLLGAFIGRSLTSEAGAGKSPVAAVHNPEKPAPPRNQIADSINETAPNPDTKQSEGNLEKEVAHQIRGLVTVPAALIGELSLAAGARKGGQELFGKDDRIAELLKITDREKAVIQTAWRASREEIRNLEVSSMKTEEVDEWTVRISVPEQTQSLASLGEGFRKQIHEALGENRAETFIAAKQTDTAFSPPPGDRSYVVTSEEAGDGNWRYRFELDGPAGRRVWVGGNIPEELRHLTDTVGVPTSLGE
jgi:hypothetical protein